MIIIESLTGKPIVKFETYNEFFECLTSIENLKLIAENSNFKHMNWSFTVYAPNLREAFEENLPLIEICTGDFKKPLHIVLTPNVDMDYLKKKWCIDYCTFHHLVVREV